jgi:hypothetical protein
VPLSEGAIAEGTLDSLQGLLQLLAVLPLQFVPTSQTVRRSLLLHASSPVDGMKKIQPNSLTPADPFWAPRRFVMILIMS